MYTYYYKQLAKYMLVFCLYYYIFVFFAIYPAYLNIYVYIYLTGLKLSRNRLDEEGLGRFITSLTPHCGLSVLCLEQNPGYTATTTPTATSAAPAYSNGDNSNSNRMSPILRERNASRRMAQSELYTHLPEAVSSLLKRWATRMEREVGSSGGGVKTGINTYEGQATNTVTDTSPEAAEDVRYSSPRNNSNDNRMNSDSHRSSDNSVKIANSNNNRETRPDIGISPPQRTRQQHIITAASNHIPLYMPPPTTAPTTTTTSHVSTASLFSTRRDVHLPPPPIPRPNHSRIVKKTGEHHKQLKLSSLSKHDNTKPAKQQTRSKSTQNIRKDYQYNSTYETRSHSSLRCSPSEHSTALEVVGRRLYLPSSSADPDYSAHNSSNRKSRASYEDLIRHPYYYQAPPAVHRSPHSGDGSPEDLSFIIKITKNLELVSTTLSKLCQSVSESVQSNVELQKSLSLSLSAHSIASTPIKSTALNTAGSPPPYAPYHYTEQPLSPTTSENRSEGESQMKVNTTYNNAMKDSSPAIGSAEDRYSIYNENIVNLLDLSDGYDADADQAEGQDSADELDIYDDSPHNYDQGEANDNTKASPLDPSIHNNLTSDLSAPNPAEEIYTRANTTATTVLVEAISPALTEDDARLEELLKEALKTRIFGLYKDL